MREIVRRCLVWGVLFTLLLPVALAVVLGLGALLSSLGDNVGATACGRAGLAVGAVWVMALTATATAGGIMALMALDGPPPAHDHNESPPRDRTPDR
ncbi:MAG: hypothetical protein HQ464_17010 [Planctomycetes bacterium]|nr:hypothetical protein [Planctomycetota bacterium]